MTFPAKSIRRPLAGIRPEVRQWRQPREFRIRATAWPAAALAVFAEFAETAAAAAVAARGDAEKGTAGLSERSVADVATTRSTIDFGIDLGTTNSAIAVLNGVDAQIIKNNDSLETTPSALWIDHRNRLYVGKPAKERSEKDPGNTCVEFKLMMGTAGRRKTFEASGRSMEPEQMSAEVLKSLRGDVAQRLEHDLQAAVITVPAAFELAACDATRRAGELAGLRHAPLLQEPSAAALAYGFQTEADNVFWLVYDFGGGTFDAAVINVRDGEFTVVNHRGDNFLGGKLIDWKIVEELLIPTVTRKYGISDFHRANPRWIGAISKLKHAAEAAKIRLSQAHSAEMVLDLKSGDGESFEFEYDLTRADVERFAEPLIVRSVNHCRKALGESGLGPGDIEKVLLVGGPTLSQYLRERLADPHEGLGIPIDHSQDPMTVVARGAAIFAGSKRLDTVLPPPAPSVGTCVIELEYSPTGPDIEPFVGGKVTGADTAGWSVEFVNQAVQWRSGKIALTADGAFTTTLWAERGRGNTFLIELTDATGVRRQTTPDRLTYTVGLVDTQPPLTQAIGVGLENNGVTWLFKRGTSLPARRKVLLRTTVAISRGEDKGILRIPVLEGEHDRGHRNRRAGRLEIEPSQVRRDVPEGSEVDLTLSIDESRIIVARAYVPLLDEEFEHVINLQTVTVPEQADLARDAKAEKHRLETARRRVDETDDPRAAEILRRIDDEQIVQDVSAMAEAARVDPDAATTCG
ncbi:Hsp70 family protein [Actinoallomurus iriomotensis]|uniref:Hsp70 family protein n=1 Tax=Actinoallomurus iriomotensis TaxID=478107 RepID=A0A9W6S6W9_9ACTN|nr:Hsp70 family protein [Actinoallomurus iriomotensis]GLY89681.1 hypothetical protein Airi02_076100 [Actinoallomurus iriomotensis]